MRNRLANTLIAAAAIFTASSATLLTGTLDSSAIYPGTVHDFVVSVPNAYTGETPAALYVGLDGPLYDAPAVIDSLIAEGSIPVTIGVYLQPGVIKDSDGEVIRYNRSNEFDAIDDRLSRFIDGELLPAAEAMTTPDGRRVKITSDPDMRAISGASSGGIGAFVAAWTRPDLFRRVYTTCGTFVAMRGGDQLPALIRKTEPKPIRVFLHDGSNDAWNPLFGHWYEQNQLMASALKFAGYDIETRWDDGGHSIRNGAALFPEAMRWLWRDRNTPLESWQSGNDMLQKLLIPGESWVPTDSPLTDIAPADVCVFPNGEYSVFPEGNGSRWLMAHNAGDTPSREQRAYLLHDTSFRGLNVIGMAFDTEGNLYVATPDGLQVADQNGRVRAILPWPLHIAPDTFGFDGDTLKAGWGDKRYSRRINARSAPRGTVIEVPSQGQA